MGEAWIWLSVMAAAFQTLRFVLQKLLNTGGLSAGGATMARFAYAAPMAALVAGGYGMWLGDWPWVGSGAAPGAVFWGFVVAGGLAQILATWCVVLLFSERNFAVGITFKKTEVVQTALVGLVVLGDRISAGGVLAIVIGLFGVVVLSDLGGGPGRLWRGLGNRAAALGLASGAFFAVSAVAYRGATLEVPSDDAFLRAMLTVAVVTAFQSIVLALWLRWREPRELGRIWAVRGRTCGWARRA